MWALKAFLRLILLLGTITLFPYFIWWVLTGLNWWDTLDSIEDME